MINLIDGLISILESWGYSGIFVLMFLESLIIPVPAEIVLIPAGFLVFKGLMSFFPLLIISTLGSLAGSLLQILKHSILY